MVKSCPSLRPSPPPWGVVSHTWPDSLEKFLTPKPSFWGSWPWPTMFRTMETGMVFVVCNTQWSVPDSVQGIPGFLPSPPLARIKPRTMQVSQQLWFHLYGSRVSLGLPTCDLLVWASSQVELLQGEPASPFCVISLQCMSKHAGSNKGQPLPWCLCTRT